MVTPQAEAPQIAVLQGATGPSNILNTATDKQQMSQTPGGHAAAPLTFCLEQMPFSVPLDEEVPLAMDMSQQANRLHLITS